MSPLFPTHKSENDSVSLARKTQRDEKRERVSSSRTARQKSIHNSFLQRICNIDGT